MHPSIQTGGEYVHRISKRGSDPLPLLNDSCLLFKEFYPKRNEWHRALYQPTSEIVEHLTKHALSIVLHNMFVCVSRQLEDNLPGGRFHNADAQLRADTSTFPKDNLSAECQQCCLKACFPGHSPRLGTILTLWSVKRERERFISTARRQRSRYLKLYQGKSLALKKLTTERLQQSRKEGTVSSTL